MSTMSLSVSNAAACTDLIEGKYSRKDCLETAEKIVKRKTANTKILDRQAEKRIPKFTINELSSGRVLGRGGFCVVNEITNITISLPSQSDPSTTSGTCNDEYVIHNIVQDCAFMEVHCIRGTNKDCRYAMKQLQDSAFASAQTYINGVIDLAIEARFLSVVQHPNIIKMRAMSKTSPYSMVHPFFVVLDRLYDILNIRIIKWKKQRLHGVKKLFLDRKGKHTSSFLIERLTVAYDLACALQFLHSMNIVYRDIKTENIGFDVRGDVKIFDLGLAKEYDPAKRDSKGMFNFTEETGSPRYMAPEVALGAPYNELVDVYSFSILLWQILHLETPFEGFTMSMFTKKVVKGGGRPKCDLKLIPESMYNLIHRGWAAAEKRPSMEVVAAALRTELGQQTGEEYDDNLADVSRKSMASLRGTSERPSGDVFDAHSMSSAQA